MKTPPFLIHPSLTHPNINHGFFGRRGGVSNGVYDSLNVGRGSDDDAASVEENRNRIRLTMGGTDLVTVYQVHKAEVVTVTAPLPDPRPQADAIVTDRPNLVLGILTADCVPLLFADANKGIIGAAHAGWRGTLAGVALNTVAAMRAMGARDIACVLGPSIQQASYEVGADFPAPWLAQAADNRDFFQPVTGGKFLFDLPAYLLRQLDRAGVTTTALAEDTYRQTDRYFSYRRKTHENAADCGRQLAAIMLRD